MTGLNPLYSRELSLPYTNNSPTHYLLATAFGEYKFFPFLKFRASITYERTTSLTKSFNPSFYYRNYEGDTILSSSRLPQNRSYSEQAGSSERYLLTNTLSFNKTFKSHTVSALVGYEEQKAGGENMSMQRTGGFPTNDWLNFGSGITSQVTATGTQSGPDSRRSWFGRANYDYKGRYLVEAVIRRDGSSRFGPANRWGTFPSGSLGWRVSDEPFFKSLSAAVDNLMFRTSYGLTGNSNIPSFYYISRVSIGEGYSFNNQPAQIGYMGQYPNPDIKWETNKLFNIGIDASFLNRRLDLTVEYYNRRSEDLLTNVTIPGTTGINNGGGILGTQIRNVGALTNRGVELLLKWHDNINKSWSYNLQFTGSYNTNKVLELNGLVEKQFGTPTLDFVDSVGLPYHSIWGYKAIGVWQNAAEITRNPHREQDQPGDLRFADIDGNGVIDDKDRTVLGNSLPKFTYGLSGGLNYKTVDFSFIFQGDWKRDYLQYGYGYFEFYQQNMNNYAYALNRWRGEGTSNLNPRLIANSEYIANQPSSYYVQDGSYLRLRHIELGYTLSKTILDKISVKNIRVYIGADNLVTFTKYYGLDPEQSSTYGRDGINYPQARTYMAGVNVTF